jgi:hypothetical protein
MHAPQVHHFTTTAGILTYQIGKTVQTNRATSGRLLRISVRKGSALKVAGFYTATCDRVMSPLRQGDLLKSENRLNELE